MEETNVPSLPLSHFYKRSNPIASYCLHLSLVLSLLEVIGSPVRCFLASPLLTWNVWARRDGSASWHHVVPIFWSSVISDWTYWIIDSERECVFVGVQTPAFVCRSLTSYCDSIKRTTETKNSPNSFCMLMFDKWCCLWYRGRFLFSNTFQIEGSKGALKSTPFLCAHFTFWDYWRTVDSTYAGTHLVERIPGFMSGPYNIKKKCIHYPHCTVACPPLGFRCVTLVATNAASSREEEQATEVW